MGIMGAPPEALPQKMSMIVRFTSRLILSNVNADENIELHIFIIMLNSVYNKFKLYISETRA